MSGQVCKHGGWGGVRGRGDTGRKCLRLVCARIAQMHGERADSFYRKIGQKLHLTVVHSVTLSILS